MVGRKAVTAISSRALSAFELNPANIIAKSWLSLARYFSGDRVEATVLMDEVLSVDPLNISVLRFRADSIAMDGKLDEALAIYRNILNLSPDSFRVHGRIARAYLYSGDFESAGPQAALEPVDWVREMLEVIILRRRGDMDAWQRELIAYEAKYGAANAYQLAEIYADAGELDQVFNWLEVAAEVRDPGAPWGLIVPFFDEARKDPRWADFESSFVL